MLSEADAIHGGHKSMKVLSKKNEAYEVLFLFYIIGLQYGDLMQRGSQKRGNFTHSTEVQHGQDIQL